MGEDTVASLGFEVNSKPLDDAKDKLKGVATEAGNTGKAVDDFNQKVGKTGSEAAKAADGVGKISPSLQTLEASAKRAGVSVEEMRARTAAFNTESGKLATSAATAGTALGAVARDAAAVSPALTAIGAASAAVTKEHNAHNTSATSLRSTLQGLKSVVGQFGGDLGGMVSAAGAARLGIAGLAAAVGVGFLSALEKASGEVERAKNRFAGLTGSAESGAKSYDAVKAAAKASGVEVSALASAVEKARIGQDQFADGNVIYANTADRAAKQTKAAADAFGTVGAMLRGNQATVDQQNKALDALGGSFQKAGKLTVDAFREIQSQSPSTALAIANAFGYKTVQEFVNELDKGALTLEQFEQRMARVDAKIKAALDPTAPKNLDQALHDVKDSWNDLLEAINKAGGFNVVQSLLVNTKKEIEALHSPLDILKRKFAEAGKDAEKSWGDFVTFADDKNSIFGKSVDLNIGGAVSKALITIGRLPSEGISAITQWVDGAISEFKRMAAGAVSAAQAAASALANIPKAAGGNVSAAGGAGGTEGIGMGAYSDPNAQGGQSAGILYPSGDAGTINLGDLGGGTGGVTENLPAFATGGSLVVDGPNSGTDKTLVQFMATKGELVDVSTPGQVAQSSGIQGLTTIQGKPAAGVIAATPDPAQMATVKEITDAIDQSTIDISKQVLTGSNNIVDALKQLIGGVASSAVNPATGLPVASTASSAASGLNKTALGSVSSATGGGGFNTRGGGMGAEDAVQRQRDAQANPPLTSQASGMFQYGQGVPIRGFRGQPSQFPSRAPINPRSSTPVNPDYSGVSDGGYNYIDAMADDSWGSGSTFSNTGTTPYGSNDPYSGNSNYSSPYGGSTANGITGADPNAMNYGGGSTDFGYFAKGGSFVAGANQMDRGTDTIHGMIHLTRGETVDIKPAGVSTPSDIAMPASAAPANAPSPASDPSSQAGTTHTEYKTVHMYLSSEVQAAQFMKSRAQIARGL